MTKREFFKILEILEDYYCCTNNTYRANKMHFANELLRNALYGVGETEIDSILRKEVKP